MYTFSIFSKPNFSSNELEHFFSRCAGVELNGVELTIHEMEPGVDGATIDCAQDLLLGWRPLSASRPEGFVETLERVKKERLPSSLFVSNRLAEFRPIS